MESNILINVRSVITLSSVDGEEIVGVIGP